MTSSFRMALKAATIGSMSWVLIPCSALAQELPIGARIPVPRLAVCDPGTPQITPGALDLLLKDVSEAQESVLCSRAPSAAPTLSRNPAWAEPFNAVYEGMCRNLKINQKLGTRFVYPSPRFPGVYLWDSAFISEVWRPWDRQVSAEIIESVIHKQRPDGRIPHVSSILGDSKWTQPPLLSWAAVRLYKDTQDKAYLARIYPKLKHYHEWLTSNRRLENGLFYWEHSYESGIDNTPRFTNRQESRVLVDMKSIGAVDATAYAALDAESLAEMAEALGKTEDAQAFRAEAAQIKDTANRLLWNAEAGYYLDLDTKTGLHRDVRTVASLVPLIAGFPDEARAKTILSKIMDPNHFNTTIPFPSVAKSDPTFEKDMWRGPVWVNMAYLSLLGMQRYGFNREARELTQRLVDGVYKTYGNEGHFFEFYDPDQHNVSDLTRKEGNLWKRITLGNSPVRGYLGWTGLVNTLALEHLKE